ncbi:MAG: hypothetical protein ACE364_04985 [Chlorobiota bacterium]
MIITELSYIRCLIKTKRLILSILLLFTFSCSTTNNDDIDINLKKIDFEWQRNLDFRIDHYDVMSIVEDTLLLTHYFEKTNRETLKSAHFENIYKFDRNSGELLDYISKDDSLTLDNIMLQEKYYKYANRYTRPVAFNMESDYEIYFQSFSYGPVHHERLYYLVTLIKDNQKYIIRLDEIGHVWIKFYIKYSNELYIWLYPFDEDHDQINSVLYKLNIDDLINKYK